MRVALVTSREHETNARSVDGPLIAALNDRDVDVTLTPWDDDSVDWAQFDTAVVRTTWNYQYHRDTFLDTLDTIERDTRLINPATLIRWNTHKNYLADLEEQGAPVIPTVVSETGSGATLTAIAAAHHFGHVIIKPAVGAGGRAVSHGTPDALAATFAGLNATEDMIVQPYLAAVETGGERSLIVANGTVTHAVQKLPAAGDFRAHERYGATYKPVTADTAEIALATWLVNVLHPHIPTIARVDLIRDGNGTLYVSELELTEPNLYLTYHDRAAALIADAIVTAVT